MMVVFLLMIFSEADDPLIRLYCGGRTSKRSMLTTLIHELGHYLSWRQDRIRMERDELQEEIRAWRLGEAYVLRKYGWKPNKRHIEQRISSLRSHGDRRYD
jgi:hypothetical protein